MLQFRSIKALRIVATSVLALTLAGCDSKGPAEMPDPKQTPARSPAAKGGAGAASPGRSATPAATAGAEGTSAADFALKDSSGKTVRLSDYKGKVVLVDFWATWCPPCRKEIPGFVQLKNQYGPRGVEVIGVAVNDQWPTIKEFSGQYGINYPVVMGDQATVQSYGNFTGIPTTFVVDKDGVIRAKKVGYAPPEFFIQHVEGLL